MSRISKADRQIQLQREEAGDHLYANRVRVYPKSVHGPVRRFKWAVLIVCLGIYYLLPWLRWHRGVNEPDQAVLSPFDQLDAVVVQEQNADALTHRATASG